MKRQRPHGGVRGRVPQHRGARLAALGIAAVLIVAAATVIGIHSRKSGSNTAAGHSSWVDSNACEFRTRPRVLRGYFRRQHVVALRVDPLCHPH